jgi:ribonucleotide monophosphatase NagD (HAD superfamily)
VQTFIFDYHGTLGNDKKIYGNLLPLLKTFFLKSQILIFSNATTLGEEIEKNYAKKGLIKNVHYHNVLTSGDIFINTLNKNELVYKLFDADGPFKNKKELLIEHIHKASCIYVSVPEINNSIYIEDLLYQNKQISINEIIEQQLFDELKKENEEYQKLFNYIDQIISLNTKKLPFIVANPDLITALNNKHAIRQGFIGAYLKFKNCEVKYFGKPVKSSLDYFVQKFNINLNGAVFFGDTIYTDIFSANQLNIEAIYIKNSNKPANYLNQQSIKKFCEYLNIKHNENLKYKEFTSVEEYLRKIL